MLDILIMLGILGQKSTQPDSMAGGGISNLAMSQPTASLNVTQPPANFGLNQQRGPQVFRVLTFIMLSISFTLSVTDLILCRPFSFAVIWDNILDIFSPCYSMRCKL